MNDTISDIVKKYQGRLVEECCIEPIFLVLVEDDTGWARMVMDFRFRGYYMGIPGVHCQIIGKLVVHFVREINPMIIDEFKAYLECRQTTRKRILELERTDVDTQFIDLYLCLEDFIDIDDPVFLDNVQFAAANSTVVREFVRDCVDYTVESESPCSRILTSTYKVPAHCVRQMEDLIDLINTDRLIVVFPHYTNVCRYSSLTALLKMLDELRDSKHRSTNYLPTFLCALAKFHNIDPAAYDFMRDFPMYPVNHVELDEFDGFCLGLGTARIADDLDRDGWTPHMIDFAQEQLKIDLLHDGGFRKFLCSRIDTPAELLS